MNDHRLYLYALGELHGPERDAFEKELAASAELQSALADTIALVTALPAALREEDAAFTDAQRQALLAACRLELHTARRPRQHHALLALAASVVVLLAFALTTQRSPSIHTLAQNDNSLPAVTIRTGTHAATVQVHPFKYPDPANLSSALQETGRQFNATRGINLATSATNIPWWAAAQLKTKWDGVHLVRGGMIIGKSSDPAVSAFSLSANRPVQFALDFPPRPSSPSQFGVYHITGESVTLATSATSPNLPGLTIIDPATGQTLIVPPGVVPQRPTELSDRRTFERIVQLFVEAHDFFAAGRYDLANKRYTQILVMDPLNIAARQGQELVAQDRAKYATLTSNLPLLASESPAGARGDMFEPVRTLEGFAATAPPPGQALIASTPRLEKQISADWQSHIVQSPTPATVAVMSGITTEVRPSLFTETRPNQNLVAAVDMASTASPVVGDIPGAARLSRDETPSVSVDAVAKPSAKTAGLRAGSFAGPVAQTGSTPDLRGYPPGTEVRDPYTDKIYRVPVQAEREELKTTGESYTPIVENPFLPARETPLSTFSIDVDTASYANVRRFLLRDRLPPTDAVRIEELINYFPYTYPAPAKDAPFSVTLDAAPAPWAANHLLVRIGLKGRDLAPEHRPPANLVFLVDVSGSMSDDDKLPLLRRALRELVLRLQPGDSVAIVTYAGTSGLALPATSGEDKQTILDAIDALRPGGSTNGASGIRLAYQIAREHFRKDGANRVLLCTDGDFNVGATSLSDLTTLIEKERATGVFLSVLGLGQGNLKDSTMETLADKGNGNYAYIDSLNEGRKVLVDQMSATLFTIAKDVKIQVEFNPATVAAYRLIGYENRLLAKEDFNDDKKDAGEIGAGHTVTALYEIIPPGQPVPGPSVDPLKYQPVPSIIENPDATLPQVQAEISRLLAGGLSSDHPLIKELLAKRQILESQAPANQLGSHITPANPNTAENPNTSDLLTVKLRYKQPDGDKSQLIQQVLKTGEGVPFDRAPSDFQFATAIAAFGLKLRGSESVDTMTWQDIQSIAKRNLGEDPGASRAEALTLIERASKLDR